MSLKISKYIGRCADELNEIVDDDLQREASKKIKHKIRQVYDRREVKPMANRPHSARPNVKVHKP